MWPAASSYRYLRFSENLKSEEESQIGFHVYSYRAIKGEKSAKGTYVLEGDIILKECDGGLGVDYIKYSLRLPVFGFHGKTSSTERNNEWTNET